MTAERKEAGGVRVITTGGTFDKTYDPVTETMRLTGRTCVPDILNRSGAGRIAVEPLLAIDSLDMSEATRADILAQVRGMDRVVVVHGTGSMVETGRVLIAAGVPGTVVLTGAMTPFSCDAVEASFNLGGAVALAGSLDPGVYIYMHGEIFDPRRTVKDTAIARFVREEGR